MTHTLFWFQLKQHEYHTDVWLLLSGGSGAKVRAVHSAGQSHRLNGTGWGSQESGLGLFHTA